MWFANIKGTCESTMKKIKGRGRLLGEYFYGKTQNLKISGLLWKGDGLNLLGITQRAVAICFGLFF
jgi:hypothetical protein